MLLPAALVARLDVLATTATPAATRSSALAEALAMVQPEHARAVFEAVKTCLGAGDLDGVAAAELRAALIELLELGQSH